MVCIVMFHLFIQRQRWFHTPKQASHYLRTGSVHGKPPLCLCFTCSSRNIKLPLLFSLWRVLLDFKTSFMDGNYAFILRSCTKYLKFSNV